MVGFFFSKTWGLLLIVIIQETTCKTRLQKKSRTAEGSPMIVQKVGLQWDRVVYTTASTSTVKMPSEVAREGPEMGLLLISLRDPGYTGLQIFL